MAGDSGLALAAKLGLTAGQRVWRGRCPRAWRMRLVISGAILADAPKTGLNAGHIFKTDRAALADDLAALRRVLAPAGFVWVSWPKNASKVPTTSTKLSSDICLSMGRVDVIVCAVDATWSGLKLRIRKELR